MTEHQSEESVSSQNEESKEFSRQDNEERDLEAGDGSILPSSNPEDEESSCGVIIALVVVVLLGGAFWHFKIRKQNTPIPNSDPRGLSGSAVSTTALSTEENTTDTLAQKMSTKKKGILAGVGLAAATAVGAYAYMNKTNESNTSGSVLSSLGFDGEQDNTMLLAGGAVAAVTAVGAASLIKFGKKGEEKRSCLNRLTGWCKGKWSKVKSKKNKNELVKPEVAVPRVSNSAAANKPSVKKHRRPTAPTFNAFEAKTLKISEIGKSKGERKNYFGQRNVVYYPGRRWHNGQFQFYDDKGKIKANYCIIKSVEYRMKKDHILVYLMTSESDRVMKIEGSNISAAKKPERQLLEALGRQEACTHKVKRGLCKTTILSGLHHLGFAAFCGAISTGMNSYEAAKTEDTPTKVTYQIVKGQLAVTVGDEEPIMHSLDCSRWTPDQISYMKLLWAKDNHWITKNIKLPAVVLTKLLKDTITPEQKVINLIRKELGQAFVENDEGKLVHAIAKPFVDVEMRKDQGMKFFGKYEKHNIEYDPGCGIWRVEHEKEGKYTHNFEIKKFEFGFDKMQNVRKATVNNEAPPFIRIFPISMTRGKWAPEERHIILKTPDGRWLAKTSGTMRFVRLILGNNQIAGCFKDHSKNELSEKVESTYAELCEFLGLDYKGHPALRLVDRSASTKEWEKDGKVTVYKDCYVRKNAKISKKFSEYGNRDIEYNGFTGAWKVMKRNKNDWTRTFRIRELSFRIEAPLRAEKKLAVRFRTNNKAQDRFMHIGCYDDKDGSPKFGFFDTNKHEMKLLTFLMGAQNSNGNVIPESERPQILTDGDEKSAMIFNALVKHLRAKRVKTLYTQ